MRSISIIATGLAFCALGALAAETSEGCGRNVKTVTGSFNLRVASLEHRARDVNHLIGQYVNLQKDDYGHHALHLVNNIDDAPSFTLQDGVLATGALKLILSPPQFLDGKTIFEAFVGAGATKGESVASIVAAAPWRAALKTFELYPKYGRAGFSACPLGPSSWNVAIVDVTGRRDPNLPLDNCTPIVLELLTITTCPKP